MTAVGIKGIPPVTLEIKIPQSPPSLLFGVRFDYRMQLFRAVVNRVVVFQTSDFRTLFLSKKRNQLGAILNWLL
jgi:hypothetical protein